MKRIIILLLIVILAFSAPIAIYAETTYSGCTLEQMAAKRTKNGIYKKGNHLYLYRNGKLQTGKIRYQGKWYYGHKTGTKTYPKGSLTRGQFRIESGNKWYAYDGATGAMHVKTTYIRKGRFKRYIDLDIRKNGTVRYVYNNASTVRGSLRYSTKELRWQEDRSFGDWHTIEGMQTIPDGWVDSQK